MDTTDVLDTMNVSTAESMDFVQKLAIVRMIVKCVQIMTSAKDLKDLKN